MRFALSLLIVVAVAVGCGPSKGTTYSISGTAVLYLHEEDFRNAAQVKAIGEEPKSVDMDRTVYLGNGAHVRVIEPADGGAKVVVTSEVVGAQDRDRIGWMLADDLKYKAE